ncbi:glycosyl hydrolases family 32 protein [Actinidia rufa]|uniref:Glycosyl hydrolases family 32 protein n=1 Tax=Actinidia rufa TaxID=165716 RepID=A0A7J0G0B9_9ERIC|nr:glycosyl hydrolases family 32 protein [Actinidia rufa]
MMYKGIYHLFYQYNPYGADWGNIVWAHSTSVDLVNWTPRAPAIFPDQPGDINGCWSGSTTILPGYKPAILYTGIDPHKSQVQNLAVPKNLSDPLLIEWVNQAPPLHSAKDTGMWECPDFFPVSSQGGLDTNTVGLGIKHVLKLSLDDTKHDYYTVGMYNLDKIDRYVPDKGSVDNDTGLRYDYGKFYASKTFYDSAKKQRILWGWINESLPQPEYVKQGWSGIQAIPRSIWLDKSEKQLVQWPIMEIEKLRGNRVDTPSSVLKGGSMLEISPVTAAQADVEISFGEIELEKAELMDPSWTNPQLLCSRKATSVKGGLGPFGLKVLASKDLKEYTAVFFRIFKGHNKSSLNQNTDKTTYGAFVEVDPTNEQLSLRSLIDHSIVESFGGGGKACITARVYPTLAIGNWAHLYAFNYGSGSVRISKLSAWSMKKALDQLKSNKEEILDLGIVHIT